MKEKKKFKETAVGKFLSEKVPDVAKLVGEAIPDKGVLGFVRNLVMSKQDLPPEDQLEFDKLMHEYEKEMFALEVQDKDSARDREIEFIKATGHADRFQYFIGGLAVVTACSVIYFLLFREIPKSNEHVIMLFIGELLGIVTGIYGYHYGSSMGSRLKDMRGR